MWLIGPVVGSEWATSGWSPVDYAVDEDSADRVAERQVEASGIGADPKARAWIVQARKLIKPLLLVARHSGGGVEELVRFPYKRKAASEHVRAVLRGAGFDEAWREYNSTWTIHPEGQRSVLFTAYGLADGHSRAVGEGRGGSRRLPSGHVVRGAAGDVADLRAGVGGRPAGAV